MVAAISHLARIFRRALKRKTLLGVFIPLVLASYFGSLSFALLNFPGPFDWRSKAISKLLYPESNPRYHAVTVVGIAATGLLMLPFGEYVGSRWRLVSPLLGKIGTLALTVGAMSLSFAALVVSPRYLHEAFARGAGICLGLGMLAFYLCALTEFVGYPDARHALLPLLFGWSAIIPSALLVAILRLLAAADLRWANPIYRVIESRALWHLGFWEWSGSVAVFLFLLCAVLLLPEDL